MLNVIDSERFEMRISPELLAAVDEWRRHQPGVPPRATAIKRLVELGLEAAAKKKPKPGAKK